MTWWWGRRRGYYSAVVVEASCAEPHRSLTPAATRSSVVYCKTPLRLERSQSDVIYVIFFFFFFTTFLHCYKETELRLLEFWEQVHENTWIKSRINAPWVLRVTKVKQDTWLTEFIIQSLVFTRKTFLQPAQEHARWGNSFVHAHKQDRDTSADAFRQLLLLPNWNKTI